MNACLPCNFFGEVSCFVPARYGVHEAELHRFIREKEYLMVDKAVKLRAGHRS